MNFFDKDFRGDETDYYEVIGCNHFSSHQQILTEYKVKALELHPDKNPEDENAAEKFALLQTAKDILTNPETRKDYDFWRESGIPIPFGRWRAFQNVNKCSMHWVATSNITEPMVQPTSSTSSAHSTKDSTPSSNPKLNSNQGFSETLRKFNNYEI